MHRTATRSACVESRPPDTPSTTFLIPVARKRVARPLRWIAYTSAQRSSRSTRVRGHEGEPRHRALQGHGCVGEVEARRDPSDAQRLLVVGAVDVAGHPHAVGDEPVEVHVGLDQRPLAAEPLRLGEDVAVLRDQRVPVPGEIGGRLVRARAGVDVRGDGPGGVRRAELLAIARLAHGDVAARRVRHHRGAGHRRVGARRDRHPEVLADLDRHREVVEVVGGEEEVGPERHGVVEQRDGVDGGLASGAEMTLLVELAVVRQVALRDDAEHLPAVQHRGDVEQLVMNLQRKPHDQHRRQCRRRRAHVIQRVQRRFDQRLLVEEILVAVADQAQLGEHRQRHVPRRGPLGEFDRLLRRCTGDRRGGGAGSRPRRARIRACNTSRSAPSGAG